MINDPKYVDVRIAKQYAWKPKEDITIYELAHLLSRLFQTTVTEDGFMELPEAVRRHFEEVP